MKKHILFFALSTLIFQSCKKESVNLSENTTLDATVTVPETASDTIKVDSGLKPESFPMPAEVEGCSCYFGENKEQFENENYVYVDDYGKNAYFKLGGKIIKIPIKEDGFEPENFSKNFENADYKVSITGRKINEMDETMMFQGSMTVENIKTGEKSTSPIYGECGC